MPPIEKTSSTVSVAQPPPEGFPSRRSMLPFNIELMKLEPKDIALLKPVTSLDYYENTNGQLHDEGLFSVPIFGRVGDEMRDMRFAYIDLGATILHPFIYETLVQLKGLYQGIMAGSHYARFDETVKDFIPTDELHGETGYAFFMEHWKDIVFQQKASTLRSTRIKLIEKYKDRAEIDKILVLPAGLRDIEQGDDGRPVVGEVNSYYRKILSVARTLNGSTNSNSSAANLPRTVLQQTFNEVFEYFLNMLKGKGGFIQSRWGARNVASGTRNVITALNGSPEVLGGRRSPKYDDSIVGLYQVIVALLPITIYQLRTRYLDQIFGVGDGQARLVDPKTLKGEIVPLTITTFDRWTTNEGLEKIINSYEELSFRKRPIMVDDYYLALIYRGPDMTFRIFSDIDELPSNLSRKYVHPINLCELLYLSGYSVWNKYFGFITRYPITGTDSTYPSSIYVKTTTEGEERRELGPDWKPLEGDEHLALEFPRADIHTFMDSHALPSPRLPGLGAD